MWPFSDDDKETKHSCEDLQVKLLECLQRSDCCQKLRKTPRECMLMKGAEDADTNPEAATVPENCVLLHKRVIKCRLSVVDARSRFRGRAGYE